MELVSSRAIGRAREVVVGSLWTFVMVVKDASSTVAIPLKRQRLCLARMVEKGVEGSASAVTARGRSVATPRSRAGWEWKQTPVERRSRGRSRWWRADLVDPVMGGEDADGGRGGRGPNMGPGGLKLMADLHEDLA